MEGKKGWLIWEEERVIEGYKFIKSPPAHGVKVEQGGERAREREKSGRQMQIWVRKFKK